jgi:hypothetical protein
MTTHKRKPFKPVTYNSLNEAEELFTEDLRGLYKPVLPVSVLNKQVRYIPVSLPQAAYMINFLIDAFAPLIMSPDERNKFNTDELFTQVIKFVSEKTSKASSTVEGEAQEAEGVIGAAFSSKAAIQYLFPVIQQCFPDLNIYKVSNECFLECFNIIFSEMFSGLKEEG